MGHGEKLVRGGGGATATFKEMDRARALGGGAATGFVDSARRTSINRPLMPDGGDEPEKELTFQEISSIKSGEKERLMGLLRERFIECGWNLRQQAQVKTAPC